MTQLVRLGELSGRYDALLCDVWGVIRDGRRLLPEAIQALQNWRAAGGAVMLVSNSPRRGPSLVNMLARMGAPDDAWDGAVTSGDAIHAVLTARAPGPAFKLGPDFDDALYEGTGLSFAPLEEAAFISCTGLLDYETETPDDYRDLLERAAARGLDMVCANPDIVVQVNDRLCYCAGALGELYEKLGGRVILAGKPHAPIYELARERIAALRGGKARLLAVGDGMATDIAGAVREGVDALFIADGIEGRRFGNGFSAQAAARLLAGQGMEARYAAPALVW